MKRNWFSNVNQQLDGTPVLSGGPYSYMDNMIYNFVIDFANTSTFICRGSRNKFSRNDKRVKVAACAALRPYNFFLREGDNRRNMHSRSGCSRTLNGPSVLAILSSALDLSMSYEGGVTMFSSLNFSASPATLNQARQFSAKASNFMPSPVSSCQG